MKRIAQISAAALLAVGLVATAKAGTIDLTTAGAMSTDASTGVIFAQTDIQPASPGVTDPFLRLQNTPTETGVNSSLPQPILDDKAGPWTHDLSIGSLGTVTINGGSYYKFLLNINQTGGNPLDSENIIQLYVVNSAFGSVNALANYFNFNPTTGVSLGAPNHTPTLDPLGAGNNIMLNYNVGHTSSGGGLGNGDMYMYVPTSDLPSSGFLYLYNNSGASSVGTTGYENDGYEEWSAVLGPGVVPVPDASTTLMLLGMAFAGVEGLRRKLSA